MQNAAPIAILVMLAILVFCVLSARLFRAKAMRMAKRLRQSPSGQDRAAALPAMVLDYARRAGAEVGAGLCAVEFRQSAEMRLKRGGLMSQVTARQTVAVGSSGFMWWARQGWGPFTRFRVIDAFVGGEGLLEVRLLGAIPVVKSRGVETSLAEAYRYLAELPLAPDAILGNPDLHWRKTEDGGAEVRLETRVGTARVLFRFDAQGDIVAMEARERPARDGEGRPVRYDWRGRYGEYAQVGERRLPSYAEVGYVYPDGYEIYFRGRIRDYKTVRQ